MHARIHEYDAAISFAGKNRRVAEKLASELNHRRLRVFYDDDAQADLLGETLTEYLVDLYQNRASYCVVLISSDYVKRRWARHEWKAAQARAFEEMDSAYILPVRLDDTDLPGLLHTVGWLDLRKISVTTAAEVVYAKIAGDAERNRRFRRADRAFGDGEFANVVKLLSHRRLHAQLMRNHAAARLLIDAYMSLGSFDEALELLRELLGSHKPNAEDEFLAGVCCYNARLLTEAQKHYENALRLAPKHLAAKEDLIRVRAKLRVGSKKRIAKSKSF